MNGLKTIFQESNNKLIVLSQTRYLHQQANIYAILSLLEVLGLLEFYTQCKFQTVY